MRAACSASPMQALLLLLCLHGAASKEPSCQDDDSWTKNLGHRTGFWRDPRWYDLQMARKMPLSKELMDEIMFALPPIQKGSRVCDLGGGTGQAAFRLLSVYPGAIVTLLDGNEQSVRLASDSLPMITAVAEEVKPGEKLMGAPFDLVLASLSLHSIVGHAAGTGEAADTYAALFAGILKSLKPGGHLIVGDHLKELGLFRIAQIMEQAGFRDVDVAWRREDMFVFGGRAPHDYETL